MQVDSPCQGKHDVLEVHKEAIHTKMTTTMYGSIAAIFPMDDGACITVSTLARRFRNSQRSHTNSVDQSIHLASLRIIHNI